MSMKEFDQIIGYETTKKELERMADALKNSEYYIKLGVSQPRGLLLHGKPGLGKTTMAKALIEASGWPVFLCRRDRPDGDFVWTINHTFEKAAESAPAIVFLDDLDKYSKSEEGCCNEEEYVAVQAGIDSLYSKNVFVLATANEIHRLPNSMLRPGRFDKVIQIETPTYQEAKEITAHFLSSKKLAEDVNTDTIAGILRGQSCAALETAVNTAGILAGYERSETITMDHLIMGCVETVHGISPDLVIRGRTDNPSDFSSELTRAAWHEAGHAVVSEILRPCSVTLVCIHDARNASLGFTSVVPTKQTSYVEFKNEVICNLAGNAALEQRFGVADLGAENDLDDAIEQLRIAIDDIAYCGFSTMNLHRSNSEQLKAGIENAITLYLQQFYSEAKQILASNMRFLEAVAIELLGKGLLTACDVQRIKKEITSR